MKTNSKKKLLDYKFYLSKTKLFYQKPYVKPTTDLVLTISVSIFFIVFAIKSTLVTIVSLSKEIKDKRQVNQSLSQKIDSLKRAQITYASLVGDIPMVEKALPGKLDFISLAQRINYLAVSHDLILGSASFPGFSLGNSPPLPAEEKQSYQSFAFRVGVSGSWQDIKSFLSDLENLDRILEINSVSFNPQPAGQSAFIQVDVNIMAFWLPKQKANLSTQP